jgi:UDP:flavonoid glycosyltransferase YjiC (YdhE family)
MKVLAYTSPARGHLYPVVPILLELQRRGHEIALRTLASQVESTSILGIDVGPVSERIERIDLDDYRGRSQTAKGRLALATFAARAEHEAPDLRAAIDRHDPDVLLVDFNCWGAATVAEASGRPWAMYAPYLLPLPSRHIPPFGLGLRPIGGPLGRARNTLIGSIGRAVLDRAVMPSLNALRAQHSLPALARFSDLLERPPLLLALTAEGFEYPRRDWPANVRLVGAINWDPPDPAAGPAPHAAPAQPTPPVQSAPSAPPAPAQSAQTPAWLAELDDPLVLVTCSTEHQRDKRLIHVALEALPAAGMSVIATTAAHDPDEFGAPPGSRVVRFVPHDVVLGRAACVVCHGGMGITQKALAAEVPVVVVPFGRDQLETARRVEVAKAGVRLSPRRLTPDRLADAVRTAIGCRAGAQRVNRAYAAAGGPAAAAEAIEAIGQRRPRASASQITGR